ncbi:MAG: energy transducer TonB [Aquificaceae bacterium]
MIGEKVEGLIYWTISLVLNLIIFSLLSAYLLINIYPQVSKPPLNLYMEEIPEIKEIKLVSGKDEALHKPKRGEGIAKKGKEKVSASPLEIEREKGDLQVPTGKPQEEPSLLQEVEQKIRGKEREVSKEGIKGEDLGNIVAVVSPMGIGFSGAGRSTLYVPPLPRIVSEEPLSPLRVRIWVEPSGVVSRVEIIQRSGSPYVDQKMLEFIRGIRFEAIRENVIQTGIVTLRFKGG